MIYVNTDLDNKEGIVYPAGMATGIYADDDGIMNLEWVSVLDYPSILEEIKSYRNQCREGTSLVDAMALYFMLGPHTEYRHQIKFLYAYFTSKLNIGTDEEITRFFKNAPMDLRRNGLGNAIVEFITSFAPIGSKIKFILANQKSMEALDAGEIFQNTLIGSWFKTLGYEIVQEFKTTPKGYPAYVLEKRNIPILKTNWAGRKALGQYCTFSEAKKPYLTLNSLSVTLICQ